MPSSRSSHRARRTVLVLTPRTAARSLAGGSRSPGRASPSAIARRISPATCSWRSRESRRSILTSFMVLAIVASSNEGSLVRHHTSSEGRDRAGPRARAARRRAGGADRGSAPARTPPPEHPCRLRAGGARRRGLVLVRPRRRRRRLAGTFGGRGAARIGRDQIRAGTMGADGRPRGRRRPLACGRSGRLEHRLRGRLGQRLQEHERRRPLARREPRALAARHCARDRPDPSRHRVRGHRPRRRKKRGRRPALAHGRHRAVHRRRADGLGE